jgi:transcription initiation factor TFIID subunit 6
VKHVLSKELQLYFERIANALTNEESDSVRETALASLRSDPGLHQLVPYLVAFIAEKVRRLRYFLIQITHNLKNVLVLNVMLHTIWALLVNKNVNIEPYV